MCIQRLWENIYMFNNILWKEHISNVRNERLRLPLEPDACLLF